MSFFECDNCGGAVGLFCHCPPPPPKLSTNQREALMLANRVLSAKLLALESQIRALRGQVSTTTVYSDMQTHERQLSSLLKLGESFQGLTTSYSACVQGSSAKAA